MTRLRVGRIRYLNTLPFYQGLDSALGPSGIELESTRGSPAEINQKMHEGEIDLAPISSLEYLNHQNDYLLLPDLCIGSRDFSGSVLLLSKERIESLDGALISLSKESLSAATLLKILLKFKFGFQNDFRIDPTHPTEMLRRAKGCLVIGDEALFLRPKEFVYKTDLSEAWWEWTHRPFCFSLWAVRRSFYEGHVEEVSSFYRGLQSNLEKNLQDIEKLLLEGLRVTLADERFPAIYGYLFNLSYGLDGEMREGLDLFFEYAHQLGVSPPPKKLEFVKGPRFAEPTARCRMTKRPTAARPTGARPPALAFRARTGTAPDTPGQLGQAAIRGSIRQARSIRSGKPGVSSAVRE